eukprot:Em0003g1076a
MKQVCSDADVAPHAHGNSGRAPHHALSRLDKSRVVTFIRNYATINALSDPGRLHGTIRDFVLESGKTMKSVYAEYCKAMESLSRSIPALQQPCSSRLTSRLKRQYSLLNVPPASPTRPTVRAVKYLSFTRLWHMYCSNIKIQPARSDLCDKCDQWLVSLRHSLSDEQRKNINDRYNEHNTKAKAFHDSYNANIEVAEKEWRGKRDKDREQILHCLESRIHLSPFISHAYLDIQMQYSFDYCQQVLLPFSSQQQDSYFGLFKKHFRRQDCVDDMEDLADCVRQCGQNVTCVPQLYQDWEYYDWNAYLGQWFGPLVGFGRCYAFEFDREHPGVMIMKTMPSDTYPIKVTMLRSGVTVQVIRDTFQSQTMPSTIKPNGLSLQRSLYLYEKVREYVHDPKKRDNVCPKPPLGSTSGANSFSTPGNIPLAPDNDQAGPSTAIPNPPTVEDHVSDGEYSEVQDSEDKAHVPGRRKRRPRSELILAYQCTTCGKKYASTRPCISIKRTTTISH